MIRRILQPGEHDHERINRRNLALLTVLVVITSALALEAWRLADTWRHPRAAIAPDIVHRVDQLQARIDELAARDATALSAEARSSARVRLTCYMSEVKQTDSTPWTTAINTKCRPGIVAVSRDLLEAGWAFGKRVWIEGHGVYVIEDVMNARWQKSIDIWVPQGSRPFRHDSVLAVLVEG